MYYLYSVGQECDYLWCLERMRLNDPSRFRSVLSGIIWGLKSKFELQAGYPLQGIEFLLSKCT